MTEQSRFSPEEWQALLDGPLGATTVVILADGVGLVSLFREGRAAAKAMTKARKQQEWPPVVEELIEAQAKRKRQSGGPSEASAEDVERQGREQLAAAGAAAGKLSAEEREAYVRWNLEIARAAAEAIDEEGAENRVSAAEAGALATIEELLRAPATND